MKVGLKYKINSTGIKVEILEVVGNKCKLSNNKWVKTEELNKNYTCLAILSHVTGKTRYKPNYKPHVFI